MELRSTTPQYTGAFIHFMANLLPVGFVEFNLYLIISIYHRLQYMHAHTQEKETDREE